MAPRIWVIHEEEAAKEAGVLVDRIYKKLQEYDFKPPRLGIEVFKNPEFRDLFAALDSKFFKPPYKEGQCVFRRRPMLGREFNYYYQGMVFAAFWFSRTDMHRTIRAWKAHYVVTGEQALHLASDNDIYMANLGYADFPKYWYKQCGFVMQYLVKHGEKGLNMYKQAPSINYYDPAAGAAIR